MIVQDKPEKKGNRRPHIVYNCCKFLMREYQDSAHNFDSIDAQNTRHRLMNLPDFKMLFFMNLRTEVFKDIMKMHNIDSFSDIIIFVV